MTDEERRDEERPEPDAAEETPADAATEPTGDATEEPPAEDAEEPTGDAAAEPTTEQPTETAAGNADEPASDAAAEQTTEPEPTVEDEPEAASEQSEPDTEPEPQPGGDTAAEPSEVPPRADPEATPGTPTPVADDAAADLEDAPDSDDDEALAARSDASQSARERDLPPGAGLDPINLEPERELSAEERARLEAEEEERAAREAAADADGSDEPLSRRQKVEVPQDAHVQATGKRKTAVARVVLKRGNGELLINKRSLEEYFPRLHDRTIARQSLVTSGYEESFDVRVRVHGGGVSSQAGAVRHGIARALTELDPELRPELKKRGMLTRDARAKERKKAGLKKARKRPQFSKR